MEETKPKELPICERCLTEVAKKYRVACPIYDPFEQHVFQCKKQLIEIKNEKT